MWQPWKFTAQMSLKEITCWPAVKSTVSWQPPAVNISGISLCLLPETILFLRSPSDWVWQGLQDLDISALWAPLIVFSQGISMKLSQTLSDQHCSLRLSLPTPAPCPFTYYRSHPENNSKRNFFHSNIHLIVCFLRDPTVLPEGHTLCLQIFGMLSYKRAFRIVFI